MAQQKRDEISLWRDSQLHGGMEILQATCYEHSYPPHFHDEFVIAAFARGAQRTRVCRQNGIAAAGSVTVKEIAQVAGLSEFYFMRTFQKMTGLSVHQYLTQIRLMRAKGLLAKGMGAAQVASDIGFFDQSHLIKHFRAHFGTTPGLFAAASV